MIQKGTGKKKESFVAKGMVIGTAIGVMIGVLTDNIGLWISLGISFGLVVGYGLDDEAKKKAKK